MSCGRLSSATVDVKATVHFIHFLCMFLWSFSALKRGVSPVQRHDNTKFADDDPRLASAGHKLHSKGACLVLKSDWMEWVKLGFRSWSHSTHPCAICLCDSSNMQQCDTVSRSSFPFGLKGFGDYDAYCRECEIYIVDLSDANYRRIRAVVLFSGHGGRPLTANFPELGLKSGDALMPTTTRLYVGATFDNSNPRCVVFWRKNKTSAVKYRNYFFVEDIGTEPSRILGPDWLHGFFPGSFAVV